MNRDPFFEDIRTALAGDLDHRVFQDCACDLLREVFPGLAVIGRGPDAGRDAAIGDGIGEPFPLVATTSKSVIANLTRSLKARLKSGETRRQVVLATSQQLSPTRRQNLEDRARELGFVLINLFDGHDLAGRLYRRPDWCRALLGLTGTPPALSIVPISRRPLLNDDIVGRDPDLRWLRQLDSDALLIGQPGVGKTFLLRRLASEASALFAVSTDSTALANAIRAQQPTLIIADDDMPQHELILTLRQLRDGLGASFSILATCWPGSSDELAQDLEIAPSQIRLLQLLSQDEIVEVIRGVGLHGPDELVHEIVNQAEGRPALAAMLASRCLLGGIREVLSGDAAHVFLGRVIDKLAGGEAADLLAAFSVGGATGMAMHDVATVLGRDPISIKHALDQAAVAGVVFLNYREGCISVHPPVLRHALVRDAYCRGPLSLDISPLLSVAPNATESLRSLIGARRRGGAVPTDMIRARLEREPSFGPWKEYAGLGPHEALWVVQEHPDRIVSIADVLLELAPHAAIPALLDQAAQDLLPAHATRERALSLLHEWISSVRPGTGQALPRRTMLLDQTMSWLSSGGDVAVAVPAFLSVMLPSHRALRPDPGSGRTIRISRGPLTSEEIDSLAQMWPQVLDVIRQADPTDWTPIHRLLQMYAYPGRIPGAAESTAYDAMRQLAAQMTSDLSSVAAAQPGVRHWLKQIAGDLRLDVQIELDDQFETLCGPARCRSVADLHAEQTRHAERIRLLAQDWAQRPPAQVLTSIAEIEHQARTAGMQLDARSLLALSTQMAEAADSPADWIRAMLDGDPTTLPAEAFLRRTASQEHPEWDSLTRACLAADSLRPAGLAVALTATGSPETLVSSALQQLEGYAGLVESLVWTGRMPDAVLNRLLQHDDPSIASAAARGEWFREPERSVRPAVSEPWWRAVATQVTDDYWLEEAFTNDPALALSWLEARIATPQPLLFSDSYAHLISHASTLIDTQSRNRLLELVLASHDKMELVRSLVGDDIEAYRHLLSIPTLELFHLAPLYGHPTELWIEKATAALDAGDAAEQV
ncbi:MAG: ATP-binding protein, partial [Anaerolineales bacterium]